MSFPVFTPPRAPSPGTSNDPEIKTLAADFGDGYTQDTRDGINNIRNVFSVTWDDLTKDQAVAITGFLVARGGTDPFYWTPSDDIQQQFICKKWSDKRGQAGLRTVTAEFRQSFVFS